MTETLNTFIDDEGNHFDLSRDIYQARTTSVNDLVIRGIGAAVRAGRAPREF